MCNHIISEIRRLAVANGGHALGYQAFVSATGISATKWRGKFWARWGDALKEASFQPTNGPSGPTRMLFGSVKGMAGADAGW
jgi:hypothetical protein